MLLQIMIELCSWPWMRKLSNLNSAKCIFFKLEISKEYNLGEWVINYALLGAWELKFRFSEEIEINNMLNSSCYPTSILRVYPMPWFVGLSW